MLRLGDKPINSTADGSVPNEQPLSDTNKLIPVLPSSIDKDKNLAALSKSELNSDSKLDSSSLVLANPGKLESPAEIPEEIDPLGKFKPLADLIDKIKFPLAGAGAMSHLFAAALSLIKLVKPDSRLAQYEEQALTAANIYSKYMSFIPLAVDSIKNLLDPKTFWQGLAKLSPMSKILAGHVSNLPFFTGGICAYNAYDRYLGEFFEANPHIEKHETNSEKRLDHLLVILKNTSTIVTNSFKNLLKGEGDFLQNLSRTLAIPGFGLPYFYGLIFARHDKLNHFVHKLVRSSRSIVGLIEDFSMAKSTNPITRIFGRVFCAESGLNSMSPWFEPKEGAEVKVDLRNPWGNLAAMIAETGNLLYSQPFVRSKQAALDAA
ncbi:MAG: hypothetical protein ACKO3R_04170 [bacterium]